MFHECQTEKDVKEMYRKLALCLHPDKGGSSELMVVLQAARDFAIEAVGAYKEYEKEKHYKHRGKYESQYDNVQTGDPKLKIILDIWRYAASHPKFSPNFVESVEEYLLEKGHVTYSQYNGLVRCYYSFRMDQEEE